MLSIIKQFLTEQKEEKQCPPGQHWCTKTLKCIPVGSGDREGPRRKRPREDKEPQNERREVVKEPPVETDGDIEIEKIKTAKESVDMILNAIGEEENSLDVKPKEEPEEEMSAIKKELGESLAVINKLMNESNYKAYFQSMLKKFGVTSPSQLKDEQKKKFFDAIEKGWTSEKK